MQAWHVKQSVIDTLPDAILLHTAELLLLNSPPAVLRFCWASKSLHERLHPILVAAMQRRLRWLPALTHGMKVSSSRCLTFVGIPSRGGWACGELLPPSGRWSWSMDCSSAGICVGVGDASGTTAWGFRLAGDRRRFCFSRGPDGDVLETAIPGLRTKAYNTTSAPTLLLCTLDADAGTFTLQHGVNGVAFQIKHEHGLPRGALRPWCRLFARRGDRIGYLSKWLILNSGGEWCETRGGIVPQPACANESR